MHKNATVADWYKKHGKHEVFAKGKSVGLESYDHGLKIDAVDAARVRGKGDGPQTAAEEERLRRKAMREAAEVRRIYEEMVLKKPAESQLVQIGEPNK
ncbi:MAG: hypothetical protein U0V70_02070 [Terriglobia bacterium]